MGYLSKMANHIVHKQVLYFAMNSKENAYQIQENAKWVFNEKALPILDELFNKYSPNGTVYRFSRLEIDLGQLTPEELEEALLDKMPLLLKELIEEKIEGFISGSSDTVETQKIPEKTTLFEALVFYLKTGIMPWWVSNDSKTALSNKNIIQLLQGMNEEQLKEFSQNLDEPLALERLAIRLILPGKNVAEQKKSKKDKVVRKTLFSLLLPEVIRVLEINIESSNLVKKLKTEIIREFIMHKSLLETIPVNTSLPVILPKIIAQVEILIRVLITTLKAEGFSKSYTIQLLQKIELIFGGNKQVEQFAKVQIEQFDNGSFDKTILQTNSEAVIKKITSVKNNDNVNDLKEALQNGIYIENAGVILLWPFLSGYFSNLGMTVNNSFKTEEMNKRAVLLLQYMVTGNTESQEYELALNKILCGIPVHFPVDSEFDITEKEEKETQKLLKTAIKNWKGIGKVGIKGFRNSFMKRDGKLQLTDSGWSLKINRGAYDMLLDRLPWMISMIKLKWMNKILNVDW